MEEIINNYNKKIEILTKDNEIDKNAKEETMSFNKFKNIALILSFIIIFIFIVLIGVPVLVCIVYIYYYINFCFINIYIYIF